MYQQKHFNNMRDTFPQLIKNFKKGVFKMKKVTKNNLLRLVDMMKDYQETKNKKIKVMINDFIDNVINKDKKYYSKLKSYNFNNEILKYLI